MTQTTPTTILIDMDDTLFKFKEAHAKQYCEKTNPFPQSQVGFFLDLEPISDEAIRTVWAMMINQKYEPWICTAPSTRNPASYTEKVLCIRKYFGQDMVDRMIITPNKGMVEADFLIDDITEGKGQEFFKGELIHFGGEEYPTWAEIRARFF